jgi:hypothetical protein
MATDPKAANWRLVFGDSILAGPQDANPLEPATSGLTGRRANRLSYERAATGI